MGLHGFDGIGRVDSWPIASPLLMATPAPATIVTVTAAPAAPVTPPVSGFVTIGGYSINPSILLLTLAIGTVLWMLWRGQRSHGINTFNFWDMVMDTFPDGTKRTSGIKTLYIASFGLSSWVIID